MEALLGFQQGVAVGGRGRLDRHHRQSKGEGKGRNSAGSLELEEVPGKMSQCPIFNDNLLNINLWSKALKTRSLAGWVMVAATMALIPDQSEAQSLPGTFANPSGFSTQPLGPKAYNFLATGDLTANLAFQGAGITLDTGNMNFSAAGTSNPPWTGGTRNMFRFVYDGSSSGGPRELLEIAFSFTTPLSTQSYLVFADFDSYEGLAIAAFDSSNNLIPFSALTLTRLDGEEPGGASATTPVWSNANPVPGWAPSTPPPSWAGVNNISGFLQDNTNDSTSNVAVAIQSAVEINRVVYYYNAESISGTGGNNLRFNFATPGPLPVMGAGVAYGFSRRLRSRIKAGRK